MNRQPTVADLEAAQRLQDMGIVVRSAELTEYAEQRRDFVDRGGNRAMRRAAKRAQRKRGK